MTILIGRAFGIGNQLLATPMLAGLKARYPESTLTWLADAHGAVALAPAHQPFVDRLVPFEGDGEAAWERLRGERFTLGIKTVPYVPKMDRFFDLCDRTIGGMKIDWRGTGVHEAQANLDLLAALGGRSSWRPLSFRVRDDVAAGIRQRLGVNGDGRRLGADKDSRRNEPRYVAISADSIKDQIWWKREWLQDCWITVMNGLAAETPTRFILLGRGDCSHAAALARALPSVCLDATNRTTLEEAAALFQLCDLAIVIDGGLLHLACASGVPVVTMFGQSLGSRHGPWTEPGRARMLVSPLECVPCRGTPAEHRCPHNECMRAITPDAVLDACAEVQRAVRVGI